MPPKVDNATLIVPPYYMIIIQNFLLTNLVIKLSIVQHLKIGHTLRIPIIGKDGPFSYMVKIF